MMESLTTSVLPWYQHLQMILRFWFESVIFSIDFVINIFSMHIFTALRTGLLITMDRTLDLLSWVVLRLSQLNCKTVLILTNWSKIIIFIRTDYVWARAMGFTGAQMADSDGVDVGEMILNILNSGKMEIIILFRNWLQANPGVQVPGWSVSSLQAHWWVLLSLNKSLYIIIL